MKKLILTIGLFLLVFAGLAADASAKDMSRRFGLGVDSTISDYAGDGRGLSFIYVINKYFAITGMPIVTSTYWNNVFGFNPSDAEQDQEGLQTMRNLAHNMAWLLKCIDLGKKNGIAVPQMAHDHWTHFI